MWQCHKCSKPVYFAERKQSLGYDWHPECLRSHKSFGAKRSTPRASSGGQMLYTRDVIETKLKHYNEYFDNKSQEIRSREVNGRIVLEGCLKVYWGVQSMIHLKEDDDQRTVITIRKRNSCRYSNSAEVNSDRSLIGQENFNSSPTSADVSTISLGDGGDTTDISMTESFSFDTCSVNEDVQSLTSGSSSKGVSPEHYSATLPIHSDSKKILQDEIDELLQIEQQVHSNGKLYQTLPNNHFSDKESSFDSDKVCLSSSQVHDIDDDDLIKTDTDYKSVTRSFSSASISNSTDNSIITNKFSDDAYQTPINSLKSVDFDDFKVQVQNEFVKNTSLLRSISDDTLKSKQPIDPSRINDSLKLYSENMMSNSYNGDFDPMISNKINQLSPTNSNTVNVVYKLSSETVSSISDLTISTTLGANGFEYSKIDSDRCKNRKNDGSDDESITLKPTTMKKRTINIKMDCCDELGNFKSSTLSPLDDSPIMTNDLSNEYDGNEYAVVLRKPKTGSTAIKRRSGNRRMRTKLRRRCSINGHFYNRETSFFTPPYGSQMSVWASSLISTSEVVNLLLEKYKVDSRSENFSLFVIRDNGEQRRLKDDENPLLVRILLGPHEDVARLFLTDAYNTAEISCEVAQFINLSIQECRAILDRYEEEQIREIQKIKQKYSDFRQKIVQRMESLKVRL